MNIKIHRGLHQIGGAITEVSTKTTKIIIDFGEELSPNQPIDEAKILNGCDAVFFTHYHGDHIGLYKHIPQTIPIYLGEIAKRIFMVLVERTDRENTSLANRINGFIPLQKILVGDIEITPLFVDHSAFDSYMFLIKADGKSVLHTGDFRGHGFRSKGLIPTLQKHVGKVDVLITEGTCLSRSETEPLTEHELQIEAKNLMKIKKYVFVLCSSTNIDRIAAFYHANPQGRYFLCDAYQKDVLTVVKENAAKWSNLYNFEKIITYGENIEDRFIDRGFCMLARSRDDHRKIIDKYPKEERLVIYSMWKGYLSGESKNETITNFLDEIDYTYLHTSGHADAKTIEKVINVVNPETIIPIHTENSDWFNEKYPDRTVREDFYMV